MDYRERGSHAWGVYSTQDTSSVETLLLLLLLYTRLKGL